MSHATTASASPSSPAPTSGLSGLPWWHTATPEQRAALERDMRYSVVDDAGPRIPAGEYLEELAEYPDAAEYLSGVESAADSYPNLHAVMAATQAAAEQDATSEEDSTASEEQAPAPTSTLKQANRTLERFEQQLAQQLDANYLLGELAYQYVQEFLGAAPGKAQRSTAVENLADKARLWDEESMSQPVAQAMKRLRERVNTLLAVHAVGTLLGDGRGIDKGNGTKKGRGKGRTGRDSRVSWSKLRELRPLVFRAEGEHAETWHVRPSVAAEARQLVVEIATSGMARKDVAEAVRVLMLQDATLELEAAAKSGESQRIAAAREVVVRWGGTLPEEPKPATGPPSGTKPPPATEPAEEGEEEEQGQEEGEEESAEQPKPALSPESKQGQNLLLAAKSATPKDAAGMLAGMIHAAGDPHAVLCELAQALTLAKHDTLTPDAVLDALLTGLDLAHLPGKAGRAVKAARLALAAKDAA